MLMGHGTKRSFTFNTKKTTSKSPSTTTNKVVTKLAKTTLKVSPPKEISLHKAKLDLLLLLQKKVALMQSQLVDKTEHKAMERVKAQAELKVAAEILKRDEHKAEKQVEREAVQRLKEVKLEGTTKVEQSPYDKLSFPQRALIKAQTKVISKFRKDMSVLGVKLPEIPNMHDAHV
ncbi:hypothetical protein F2Q69_00012074 [Brassica cretica]|uniref:Uncharacterized protein n=1 Tax=Brassica cretica TaxID=69181 RepID=A0A8S9QZI5_BRACR|nr:hypothetical protein F2Q69_00012074 [Brassica cretica]